MDIRCFPAKTEDIEVIYTLCKKHIEQYESDPVPMDPVLAWCRRKIETKIGEYEAVFVDGKKAGFVHLSQLPDGNLELDDLYLFADFRGKGVGTALIRRAVSQAKVQRKQLLLYVFRANERALRLYQREGFVIKAKAGNSRYVMEHHCG